MIGPAVIALAAWLAVVVTLDGVGERPSLPEGPGVTLDEIFNIQTGVYLWRSLVNEGAGFFTPSVAERIFTDPLANPDHPPLGRLGIGLTHDLTLALAPPAVPSAGPYSLVCARVGPATAFALTVLLVGWTAARWYGAIAGWVAATSLALMPHVFAHAHLASLETFVGLTYTATVLYVASRWSTSQTALSAQRTIAAVPWGAVILGGVLFGLTLLTKIQAVLLPIPIGLWCLWRWGWRSIPMMLLFGLTGLGLFIAAWPWIWLDPVDHLLQYLGRATDRPTLYCHYLGERYADRDVPWHYSFVMFAVSVPIVLHALGLWSVGRPFRASNDSTGRVWDDRSLLLVTCVLFVLVFFALPGITVYDGTRLFLVIYPLWAVLIGRGAARLMAKMTEAITSDDAATSPHRHARKPLVAALALVIGTQSVGAVSLHPCQLSYYNLLTGGLAGADVLGFEPTYWRDSLTREFLQQVADRVPAGTTLYLAPVLHPANRLDLPLLSPILQHHGLTVDSYDHTDPAKQDMRYVLVYRRHADPWSSLEPAPAGGQLLAEVTRRGVQLAALYDLTPSSP